MLKIYQKNMQRADTFPALSAVCRLVFQAAYGHKDHRSMKGNLEAEARSFL